MPRGGKRPGAGRPAGQGQYGEQTTTIRVPLSAVDEIRAYLRHFQKDAQPVPAEPELGDLARARHPSANIIPLHAARGLPALPLVGARVAAGLPAPADDFIEDRLDLHQLLIRAEDSTYLVKVQGESMIEAGIQPGDMLIVDRSRAPATGDIVIAVLDGELTVKRLEKQGARITLVPENPDFEPIVVRADQELFIWGIVTYSVHAHRRGR